MIRAKRLGGLEGQQLLMRIFDRLQDMLNLREIRSGRCRRIRRSARQLDGCIARRELIYADQSRPSRNCPKTKIEQHGDEAGRGTLHYHPPGRESDFGKHGGHGFVTKCTAVGLFGDHWYTEAIDFFNPSGRYK